MKQKCQLVLGTTIVGVLVTLPNLYINLLRSPSNNFGKPPRTERALLTLALAQTTRLSTTVAIVKTSSCTSTTGTL